MGGRGDYKATFGSRSREPIFRESRSAGPAKLLRAQRAAFGTDDECSLVAKPFEQLVPALLCFAPTRLLLGRSDAADYDRNHHKPLPALASKDV